MKKLTLESWRNPVLRGHNLLQLVAVGLLLIQYLIIASYLASAIANEVMFASQQVNGVSGIVSENVLGATFALGSAWSLPPYVVFFLFAPILLVAWSAQDGRPEDARVESMVLKLGLVLASLTALGGVLSVVGRVLQSPPSENWGGFLGALGLGVGSVFLAILGAVTIQWLTTGYPFNHHYDEEDEVGTD